MASPEAVTEPKVEEDQPGPSTAVEMPVKAESPEAAPMEAIEEAPEPVEPVIDLKVAELQKEPLFAEICSFFNFFAGYLAMKPQSFPALETMFCLGDNDQIHPSLIDLHLTLLRKVGYKSARADRWESVLQKFLVYIKMEEEALQLERLGYADLPLGTKLEAMFHLCSWQFDSNVKFKETVFNTLHTFELRFAPVGRDMNGLNYWFQRDYDLNIRLYTEEPEDKSGGTWRVVARSHSDLIKLLNNLRSVDFNRSSKESSAEVDEEQALSAAPSTKTSPSKPGKTEEKSPQSLLDPDFWKLSKPEVAQKYYTYLAKRNSYIDQFRDGSDLNKKKNEKLAKKAAKAAAATTAPASKQSTPKPSAKAEDEEPEIPAELLEDRRILPRRTARNAAISNLKSFSTPTRAKKETEAKREDTAEPDASDNDDDDGFEDDDESDRSLGSSDEEFNLPGRRSKGIRRPRRPRADGEDTPKPKKRKKKPAPIAFESSDDEDGEEEEVKERKKATSQSRCQACEASTHWEVLLLCDMCDSAWHTFCLKPRLWYVPDDDWFCPMCQHAMLVDRLTTIEKDLCEALKVKEVEDAKKKLAAERLKREMEYIGISLNNVVSSNASKQLDESSMSEESEEEDDGQRKSKKRAMKKVMHNNRQRQKQARHYGPVITVAEGRSRRSTKKVDYNFSAYDEQLQEAMDTIDEPSVKTKYENDHRPAGGAGKGKDMSNITDADRKRHHDSEDYEDENDAPLRAKKRAKASKRLTDLNIDDATESETDEYQASDSSVQEPSEEDYVPSDEERRTRRSGAGARRNRQSDDDFIDDSDSDYNPGGRKRKRAAAKPKRRSGRKKYVSDDSEEEGSFQSESEEERRPKKKSRVVYSSDEEPSSSRKKTATGRPMRRAAAKAVLKESDDEELEEDADEDTTKKKEERPVGALSRRRSKPDDADEFKPDDDEEDEEEEEEEEELEEEEEDEIDEEEEEQQEEPSSDGESTQDAPTMVKKSPAKKAPPKRRAPTPPPVAKKLPPPERVPTPTPPPKKDVTPAVAPPASKPSPKPTVSAPEPIHLQPAEVPSTSAVAPPPTSSIAMVAPVPLLSSGVPAHSIHGFAPPPNSANFYAQPGQPLRFAQPGMYGGPPPPGAYYPGMPPPMGYPPHPQMVPHGYVLQPPHTTYGHPHPTMLQPQFQSSMTLLEPMHSHLGPPPPMNAYSGLQPIQLASQPSDADGLAQAITGALNDL
uniref:PHD-type domain-containing protein n=1 Tax=Panagrellus redivivus TaxID=6233 RepID=A0A7E4WBJ9_PANRE